MSEGASADAPWWRHAFDRTWLALHEPLFPEELNRREVAAMLDLLALPVNARILDAPCGWGRHTRLLQEAGFRVTGADLSFDLLRHGRGRRRGANRTWVAAELRSLPFADASFDAALDVFTSIGLFASDRDEATALRELRRVIRPGGVLLLETMHRDDVVANYAERAAWSLPDGTRVRAERAFDPLSGESHEVWHWRRDGEQGTRSHTLRLRTAGEIVALLRRAGFRDLDVFGDWDGSPFTHRSARMIVLARAQPLARRAPAR